MARQPVFWILLSACWQSVQAGLLEQAIDTVQKTIFPDQQAGNPFANIPAFRSSKIRTINGSADDPTSMHFRNQDFSIVLGKDGLKTIDSILDRVFNLTTKLRMQKGKSFNVTATNENTSRYNEDPETSTLQQVLETTNDFPPSDALITAPFEERNKFFVSSEEKHEPTDSQLFQKEVRGTSGSLKTLIRKRPILTDRDAPHYFDPVDGLLKANDEFNKFDSENSNTAKSLKKTDPGNSPSFASEQKLSTQNLGKQIIEKEQDVSPEGNQSRTDPRSQLQKDISPDQLTDDGQNSLVNDGDNNTTAEDERTRLVALQLPGVGSFVVQKPPEKPKLTVKQKWLLGPLLEPESTNRHPVSSSLAVTTMAARVSQSSAQISSLNQLSSSDETLEITENDAEGPVILSEPARSVFAALPLTNAVEISNRTEKDFKLSVSASGEKLNSSDKNDSNSTPQVNGEFEKDVWGSRFDFLGIPNAASQVPVTLRHDLRHHLPREVLPLALKQQMRAPASTEASKNSNRNRKEGKEIGKTEKNAAENYTTFSITSPNLENIVIYTNNPNIEVSNQSSTLGNIDIFESDDGVNATGVLTDEELPLYPPLGNFDVDVALATNEAEDYVVDESTDTKSITNAAPSDHGAADSKNVNQKLSPANDTRSQTTQSLMSTFFNTTPSASITQETNVLKDGSSPNTGFEGSSYQFYSSPGGTNMYQSGMTATRGTSYGGYKTYASPTNTFPALGTQFNDFVSGTSSASESSAHQLSNFPRSSLSSSLGSTTNDAGFSQLGSDSLTWPTHDHKSQDLVLQTQFFDPTLQQENLRDYLRRIFRLNQLVPIDLNRAITKLLLEESSSYRQFNERSPFSQLSPAQQSVLFSLTDFSSPSRAKQFSLTQPRLRSVLENPEWLVNANAEETARNIFETLTSASRQNGKNRPFHRRNSFTSSHERLLLPFNRRSRSVRKLSSGSYEDFR